MFVERGCPICRRAASAVCSSCWNALEPAPVRWLASPEPGPERDLEVRSLFAYSPEAATMLLAAKNRGRRQVLRQVGSALARELTDLESVDAVTWIPASADHRRSRGYDQGRLLARAVAAHLGVPARTMLRRVPDRSGASQKGKSRADRLLGAGLMATRQTSARLVLVDDVVTTGASLRHGADALFEAGATTVNAAVVASADRRLGRGPEVTFGPLPGVTHPA